MFQCRSHFYIHSRDNLFNTFYNSDKCSKNHSNRTNRKTTALFFVRILFRRVIISDAILQLFLQLREFGTLERMLLEARLRLEALHANVASELRAIGSIDGNIARLALLDVLRAVGEIAERPATVGALVRLNAQMPENVRLVLILQGKGNQQDNYYRSSSFDRNSPAHREHTPFARNVWRKIRNHSRRLPRFCGASSSAASDRSCAQTNDCKWCRSAGGYSRWSCCGGASACASRPTHGRRTCNSGMCT